MLTKLMQDVTDERSLREFNSAVFRDIYQLRLYAMKVEVTLGTGDSYYLVCPFDGKINKFWAVVDDAGAGNDPTITLHDAATQTIGLIEITDPVSAGDSFEDITLSNDNVNDGDVLYIATNADGGGRAEVTILLERSL